MSLRIVLLMLLLQAPIPPRYPPGKGGIEGIVLADRTNEPIEDAVVILARASDAAGRPDAPSSSVMTDRQGRFVFKDLEAGAYRLAFESDGFVRQEYGQRVFPGSGTTLELAEAQELRDLVVRMTRTAGISGRILDEDKQPVAGVPVQLLRSRYAENGERELQTYGTARTDDRGEYRLYFVTPGRYYLHAGTPEGPNGGFTGLKPSPNEVPAAFASMYYPGVADLKFAMPLDVKAASEIGGIDWTTRPQRLFRIRGRVIDTTTGQSPTHAELSLFTEFGYPTEQFGGAKGSYEDGIFEFRDVVPGSYGLQTSRPLPIAYIPVEVVSSDLDGLVLPVSPGEPIAGRVRIDREDSQLAAVFKDRLPSVSLLVAQNGSSPHSPGQWPLHGDLYPDGTFRIPNVQPGEYKVWLPALQSSFYIKEAWFGGNDVLSRPLQFTGKENNTLDILLSSSAGTLNGSVTVGQGSAAGVQVVLVPDRSRHRWELFRAVMTNQDGRFSISKIVPGDYKVFAWEAIEPNSWFDPQVLLRGESSAKSVHIAEWSTQTIETRAVAAQ